MQKLSRFVTIPIEYLKKKRQQRQRKKFFKRLRKSIKKVLHKKNLSKIVILIAALAMLFPLILPFIG